MTDRSDRVHDERGAIAGETRAIPFIFRIDVEPDVRHIDRFRPLPWSGFERAAKGIESIRERLAAATGSPAHFVWLLRMDPQIGETYGTAEWVAEGYSSFFKTMIDRGDDIGVHPHTFRWTQQQRWVTDFNNQDWVDYCVRVSFEAYRRTFDRECEVVAFGDRWLNNATVRLLEELGTKYDLTVEPGLPTWPRSKSEGLSTDDSPAFTNTPRRPYRPAAQDFRIADADRRDGMWMLPLTTARVPRDPLKRVFDALRRIPPETKGHMTLNPSLRPSWFRAVLESALQRPTSWTTSPVTGAARSPPTRPAGSRAKARAP